MFNWISIYLVSFVFYFHAFKAEFHRPYQSANNFCGTKWLGNPGPQLMGTRKVHLKGALKAPYGQVLFKKGVHTMYVSRLKILDVSRGPLPTPNHSTWNLVSV